MQKFLGKRNCFISATHIHDIVINEVLEDVSFITNYLLINNLIILIIVYSWIFVIY